MNTMNEYKRKICTKPKLTIQWVNIETRVQKALKY